MKKDQKIIIKGARVNNLQNVSVEIPAGKLTCITGLSGSGKSSLAFDTLFAEGQRRYVESLSAYARQFLGRMLKPDVDIIEGIAPAIAIAKIIHPQPALNRWHRHRNLRLSQIVFCPRRKNVFAGERQRSQTTSDKRRD